MGAKRNSLINSGDHSDYDLGNCNVQQKFEQNHEIWVTLSALVLRLRN